MMRLRVGGNAGNYAWMAFLDTDGDASNVEWALQLIHSGSSDSVRLAATSTGGPTIGDVVVVDVASAAWTGGVAEFSRWTSIPSTTHYHVDMAMPWAAFTNATGVTDMGDVRVLLATSTTHSGINGDVPLNASLTDLISSVLSDNIPEPASATLILGMGCGMLVFRRLFRRGPEV